MAGEDKPGASSVALMLTGGRVTAEFRASLFAAASRSGLSVNELVLRCAGEKLREQGARFEGVFAKGDLDSVIGAEPFPDGTNNPTKVDLGSGLITDRELRAFNRARGGRSLFQFCVDLMRANVEFQARVQR